MHYTISLMSDPVGDQNLSLDKVGNQYRVGLRDFLHYTYKHRTFDTLAEAEAKFLYLASCIIRGNYSFEGRVEILFG